MPTRDLQICLGIVIANGQVSSRSSTKAGVPDETIIKSCTVVLSRQIVDSNYKLDALVARAAAYTRTHSYDLALVDLDAAVELRARDTATRITRAGVYLVTGKLDQAISDYGVAVEFSHGSWAPYWYRGYANLRKGDLAASIADFSKSLELKPANSGVLLGRAIAYKRQGASALAEADFAAAIAPTPRTSADYNSRCWAKAAMGSDLPGALADCREALRLDPKNPAAMDSLAFVELRLGDYGQAIADYDKVIASNEAAASLYGRGVAKLRSGDAAGGNADIAKALRWNAVVADEFASDYGVKP